MRRVIRQAIRANNKEGGPTMKEFWNAVNNIGDPWAEIKESKMHVCWMRLFLELVQDFKGFDETPEDATKEVVHLMNELNLYQH
jgi:hypothetical protein